MRAMSLASPRLAALERATLSRPLRREVHGHGQRPPPPVPETSGAALVLLDQEPPRQLVLRVAGFAGTPVETLPRDADRYPRIAAEVLHPVRAVAAPGEHVEGPPLLHEGEPYLDLVRPPRHTPRRRQITEILVREAAEIGGQLCVLRFALAKLDAPDLAARGLGQLFDELYLARILVGGRLRLAVVL